MVEMSDFTVLPVHQYVHLLDECSEILNEQWPRSKAARNHSINKSTDALPVSLAFVRGCENQCIEVLGFSKISAVQGINDAGLVESVVLKKEARGKGLGRILMNLTEDYGHRLGIKTIYLSTKDKEGFYAHLGYKKCQPVLSLGANAHRVPESMLRHFMAASSSSPSQSEDSLSGADLKNHEEHNTNGAATGNCVTLSSAVSQVPACSNLPPPPPPSLPPPPPTITNSSLSKEITRVDPNSVTWMKKDLH